MKDKIIPVLMVFGLSMFCGIVGIAIGIGSLFIPLNQIAGPMVCGDRQVKIEQSTRGYLPNEVFTTITAYCVNEQTGERQDVTSAVEDITTKLQITSGIIYSLIIFALSMLFLNWVARRLGKSFDELFQPSVRRNK
jgi:predicted PurR-regulated permease PerM